MLASRNEAKCRAIADSIHSHVETAEVDADKIDELIALFKKEKPALVINVALPYQDLTIMDACLAVGVHYLDTANYEPRDTAIFEYHWQWDYQQRFKAAGLTALLGSGFDPGAVNVFVAYAAKHYFDEIHYLDIVDVNGGEHGLPFATNFNPEINLREISAPCRHWEDKQFITSAALSVNRHHTVTDFTVYRMYHEELESLTKHFPSIRKAQFWMSFSDKYLNYLDVLNQIGMISIETINHQGMDIAPLDFLKSVLPDPATLGSITKGRTYIACEMTGIKNGKKRSIVIYNSTDHQSAFKEVGSQAISYTTGVAARVGAEMILTGKWSKPGVWNMEQFDPDPYMFLMMETGLPWHVVEREI
jgi:saccharopine dehydrogenase (NAD+, L-lysine-forming)